MNGSWRFTIGFGVFGALLTCVISLSNNPLGTTLLRSFYAFLAFVALAFAASFVLGQLLSPGKLAASGGELSPDRGSVLDLTTPDEGEALSEMLKEQWSDGNPETTKDEQFKDFQPLQPKRVVSLDNPNPEEVAQAIRRLTDE
ncbi:hypothetical protein [Cohnella cellulosilytica]|uniref:Uncharacterized protein n=1 Tax=Cohnella cellulosilytica TaxID=986710 RepID=A0ABW2FL57_9BACL